MSTNTVDWGAILNGIAIASVGSFAGAFAGALGAQRIAERSKGRDDLRREIRNVNAAIMVAFDVCNTLLSVKKQYVKDLRDTYDAHKREFIAHCEKRQQQEPLAPFEIRANLMTLSLPPMPIDVLQTLIFERLFIGGRPLVLTTALDRTVDGLTASFEARNRFIESFKQNPPNTNRLITLYFGLPFEGGVNTDYPSFVEAIYSQTDDGIYYSKRLADDLVEYGEKCADTFKERFGLGAPNINKPVWKDAGDLMPEEDAYADWARIFVKAPEVPKKRWWKPWRSA